jgi:hypothetical protein
MKFVIKKPNTLEQKENLEKVEKLCDEFFSDPYVRSLEAKLLYSLAINDYDDFKMYEKQIYDHIKERAAR